MTRTKLLRCSKLRLCTGTTVLKKSLIQDLALTTVWDNYKWRKAQHRKHSGTWLCFQRHFFSHSCEGCDVVKEVYGT